MFRRGRLPVGCRYVLLDSFHLVSPVSFLDVAMFQRSRNVFWEVGVTEVRANCWLSLKTLASEA